jgi:hypothetical protein
MMTHIDVATDGVDAAGRHGELAAYVATVTSV